MVLRAININADNLKADYKTLKSVAKLVEGCSDYASCVLGLLTLEQILEGLSAQKVDRSAL